MGEPMVRMAQGTRDNAWVVRDGWLVVETGHSGRLIEVRILPDEEPAETFGRLGRVLSSTEPQVGFSVEGLVMLDEMLQDDLDERLSGRMLDTTEPDIKFTYKGKP